MPMIAALWKFLMADHTIAQLVPMGAMSALVMAAVFWAMAFTGMGFAPMAMVEAQGVALASNQTSLNILIAGQLEGKIYRLTTIMCQQTPGTPVYIDYKKRVDAARKEYFNLTRTTYPPVSCRDVVG